MKLQKKMGIKWEYKILFNYDADHNFFFAMSFKVSMRICEKRNFFRMLRSFLSSHSCIRRCKNEEGVWHCIKGIYWNFIYVNFWHCLLKLVENSLARGIYAHVMSANACIFKLINNWICIVSFNRVFAYCPLFCHLQGKHKVQTHQTALLLHLSLSPFWLHFYCCSYLSRMFMSATVSRIYVSLSLGFYGKF